MHMHKADQKYIEVNNYNYQFLRFYEKEDGEQAAIVVENKVIHLAKDKSKIRSGILRCEDL